MHRLGRTVGALAVFLVIAVPAGAQATRSPRIAVLDFEANPIGFSPDARASLLGYGSALADLVSVAWSGRGTVEMVERRRIEQVLREQQLVVEGRVDSATAVRIGVLLGATHILFGSVIMEEGSRWARITGRTVEVETSRVLRGTVVRGRRDGLLDDVAGDFIDSLSRVLQVPQGSSPTPSRGGRRDVVGTLDGTVFIENYMRTLRLDRMGDATRARAEYRRLEADSLQTPPLGRMMVRARLAGLQDSLLPQRR
jgi:hypothetical protein